LLAIIISCY